jgi:serine/threonine-protein kinase
MGDVYRTTDAELGREVAVKVLAERYAQDEELRLRFRREALAAARLSGNPHIVTIFDVAEHEGRPLIVMELEPGGSLEQRVAGRAPCPPAQVLDWLGDAADALDAAHAAGIVHRDVKPGNLLLGSDGRVKVADFGIASAVGLDSFTQTGTILGTAGYLSPEQARGERATPASDRYSLAVVAWELLAGHRPFESETATAEAAAHAHAPVPPISQTNPDLPRAFDAIFARALAKDPARRFPTAAELVGELRRALHEDAGDTWIERLPHVTPAPPRHRSRRLWLPLVVALLAAAGIAAAVLGSRGGGHRAAPPTAARSRTVVRTVTEPGTTVQQTVTAAPPPPTEATTTAPAAPSGTNGAALNNEGYARMRAGDYAGALPLLQRAVDELRGTGSVDEAYADYNLAYTRFALGDCTDVLALLDASERIQGHRSAITRLRHDARRAC